MIDIVTNNVRQIGTPADEGRVYISEKAYKRIKTEGFKDKEVFVLMGHTESSGGRYATFVEAAIAVYDMEFDKNAPLSNQQGMEQSVCGDKEKLRGADYRRMGIQAGGFSG